MEYQCFQVEAFLRIGIGLLFLVGNVSGNHWSSAYKSGGHSSDDDGGQPKKSVDSFHKYITAAYFEKHESLDDSDFQDFIAHELSLGWCKPVQGYFVPRLSVWNRHLIGEGSHRRLSTSVGFTFNPESLSGFHLHFCTVISVERLPSGVFADPFELQHLIQRGAFTDASAFGDTNLELPSLRSNRSIVEVHMDIGSDILSKSYDGLKIKIELPLHARYPPLQDNGYSRVEFGSPELFLRCIVEGKSGSQSCLFVSDDDTAKSKVGDTVWDVPCGVEEHAGIVSVLTFVSASVSTFLVVMACIFY